MPCPRCGEVCHCASDSRTASRPHSRFRPDESAHDLLLRRSSVLIDPEADDGSEDRFAASLDNISESRRLIANPERDSRVDVMENDSDRLTQSGSGDYSTGSLADPAALDQPGFHPALLETDLLDRPGAWRQEVAARLHSYRARRKPRPPKYPSLRLKFESTDVSRSMGRAIETVAAAPQDSPGPDQGMPNATTLSVQEQEFVSVAPEPQPIPERARIIEFPRPYVPPAPSPDELAEVVAERPRILEVPDVEPPPPALGGILLEPEEEREPERRPGFEIPLKAASMPRRMCAAAIDGLMVLAACAIFAYINFRLSPIVPPLPQIAVLAAGIASVFWSGYQYLLLVYTGSTPGLHVAQLRLSDFDGTPVPRSRRRWRVIASILSGLSLGLGFAWCFLDEDALCWHDRITHTYLAPSK